MSIVTTKCPSKINFIYTADKDEIAQVIIDFQRAGFPITVPKLQILAWQYDHINSINAFAKNKDKKVGHTWAKYFLCRYPHIRVRKVVNLSKAWAMAANEPNLKNGSKSMPKSYRNLILSPQSASGLGKKWVCRQCQRRRSTWAKSMSLCTALSVQTRGKQ